MTKYFLPVFGVWCLLILSGCAYKVERPDHPFLDAAFRGNVRELQMLASKGENAVERESVNCRRFGHCSEEKPLNVAVTDPETGKNALHYAAYQDNRPALRYLISLGVPLNQKDAEGRTPLYDAVVHRDALSILLEAGAEIHAGDKFCGSLLYFALQRHAHPDRFEQLVQAGAKAEKDLILDFMDVAFNWEPGDYFSILTQLKKGGAQPGWSHPRQKLRTKKERQDYARLNLMEKKFLPNGKNALHMAVLFDVNEVIPPLVTIGVPLSHKDANGDTPLSLARALLQETQKELKSARYSADNDEIKEKIGRQKEAIRLLSNS